MICFASCCLHIESYIVLLQCGNSNSDYQLSMRSLDTGIAQVGNILRADTLS